MTNQNTAIMQPLTATEIAKNIARLQGLSASQSDPNKVSLEKNIFHFPEGAVKKIIEVAILDIAYHNVYYPGRYNPQKLVLPTCEAIGYIASELEPQGEDPQANKCSECRHNEWINKQKVCKNRFRVAFVPAGGPIDQIYYLEIAPTGLKPFEAYIKSVTSAGFAPYQVTTQLWFDQSVDYPKLTYTNLGVNAKMAELLTQGTLDKAKEVIFATTRD